MNKAIYTSTLLLLLSVAGVAQSPATGTIDGHEYVDLGLPSGLKWATCNIGAIEPTDYGNYYAWGETSTKSPYYSSNCKTNGALINDFSGNSLYDAATANWGNSWRTPKESEYKELFDNCVWIASTQTNLCGQTINGLLVKGPNGNTIFLPAAGYYAGSNIGKAGEKHSYWSSTPDSNDNDKAWYFYSLSNRPFGKGSNRYFGRTVRAVTDGTISE